MVPCFIEDGVVYKGKLYFLIRNIRALCVLDLERKNIETIININDETPLSNLPMANIGRKCFFWNENIIITPSMEDKIQIYDINSKNWRSIDVNCIKDKLQISRIFNSALINDRLFMVGCHYPAIIICDLEKKDFKVTREAYARYKGHDWEKKPYFARYGNEIVGSKMILHSNIDKSTLEIEMESGSINWIGETDKDNSNIVVNDCYERIYKIDNLVFKKHFFDGTEIEQKGKNHICVTNPEGYQRNINMQMYKEKWDDFFRECLRKGLMKASHSNKTIQNETPEIGLNEFIIMLE